MHPYRSGYECMMHARLPANVTAEMAAENRVKSPTTSVGNKHSSLAGELKLSHVEDNRRRRMRCRWERGHCDSRQAAASARWLALRYTGLAMQEQQTG